MQACRLFKSLADPSRFTLIALLHTQGESCVCDLVTALAIDQPKTSRYLAELRKHELLVAQRRGKWMYYNINPSLPAWVTDIIQLAVANSPSLYADALARLRETVAPNNSCC